MGATGPESPSLEANLLSRLFFWWLCPLLHDGKSRDLTKNDLHEPLPDDISEKLGTRLEKHWRNEIENARRADRKPQLLEAIIKTFGLPYLYLAGPTLILSCLKVLQAYALQLLIQSVETPKKSNDQAYLYALSIILLTLFHSLLKHHIDLANLTMGMRLRIACSSLIFRKTLKLSNASVSAGTGGRIINLMSNDAARFDPLFMYLHYVWISPLQGLVVAYLIWETVGVSSLVGIVIIAIGTIPVHVYVGKLTSKLRGKIAAKTDERIRLMSEIINGIHVIKMYTWEKPFQYLVSIARSYEIDRITSMAYLKGINYSTTAFTDRICVFFTIAAYTLSGNSITADKVFSMVQYFNLMLLLLVYHYPRAIFNAAEARVSINRIENFLLLEEIKIKAPLLSLEDNARVTLKSVTACWTPNSIVNTLHDISLNITPKKLHAVIGPVGSGKTSLLQLILGELPVSSGDLKINGTMSYASQRSWLFPGSIRENVIFDQLHDESRYREVLKVCALERDLERLPRGDLTQVGERGCNLSGGQCARINLARAVYRDADIYLFDDPLSSVDPNVCNDLFNNCINGFLKDKTRVFVTHQLPCLKEADTIFLLNNGKLDSQGKFADFPKKEIQSLNILTDEKPVDKVEIPEVKNNKNNDQNSLIKPASITDDSPETQELIAKGKMKSSIFLRYFFSGNSYFLLISTLLCFVIAQSVRCGSDYWLSYWTDKEKNYLDQAVELSELNNLLSTSTIKNTLPTSTGSSIARSTTILNSLLNATSNETLNQSPIRTGPSFFHLELSFALTMYGCLVLACIVSVVIKVLLFHKLCMRSSKSIHEEMFSCVLSAPMRFFDKQTSGQILNRFSKDVGTMDEILPITLFDAIEVLSITLGIIFFQLFVTNWWSILPVVLSTVLYWKIKDFYLPSAYGIKRLEGAAKSPVLSYVTSSLEGLAIIRSSRGQTTVSRRFDARQDAHTRAHFLNIAAASAFGLWLDLVSVGFVAFITLNCVINRDVVSPGELGLAITQVLILCGMLQRGIRQMSEAITQMTSVERVLQFTEIDQEENCDEAKLKKPPPGDWPGQGKIEFRNYSLKYADDDVEPVLKNVNVLIEPGTKVGIVGRTGAGKSSLILALFRLARADGEILIDDVETYTMSLRELRKRLAIIPQEPVLFSTSLRDNLDPYHEFEDARLWAALEDVQLHKAFVPLDHPIECSGKNLSAGQRQLLCLARAIVKKTRILVLDEASANVDPATDSLIRETINSKFQDCTVLTVAHRLESIIDSDVVLVIDNGEVVEFDRPHNLLEIEDGAFAGMAKQTGEATFEHLRKVAEEAFTRLKEQTESKNLTVAEVEPERTENVVEESERSTPEVTVEVSQVSTPDDTITETRASTPDEGISSQSKTDVPIDDSQVSDSDSPASITPDEKILEKKISTISSVADERPNSNGLLKNSEITEAVDDKLEKP